MSLLSTKQLTTFRHVQGQAFPSTCSLYARSLIGDGQGGQRETWGDAVSASCRLAPMSKEQAAKYAEQLGAASGWVVTLPHNTTVNVYDKIVIDNVTYRVIGTNENESWITALRAYCARVK